jgi:hypothetical protein
MPQGIVDVFKAIQIHKEQRGLALVAMRQGDCLTNPVV